MDKATHIQLKEFEKAIDTAHYYDQIGWLIFSFFLIFFGALVGGIFSIRQDSICFFKPVLIIILIASMLFGLIVLNLFSKTQAKKLDEYKLCCKVGSKLKMKRYENMNCSSIKNSGLDQAIFFTLIFLIEIGLSWIILLLIIK